MNRDQFPLILALLLICIGACKKDDFGPELIARTGPDTTANIGDTVWLDASASSGSNYQVMWTFQSQPGDDTISNPGSDSAYFIPYYNGLYQVKLTLNKEDIFNSDYQNITVSGPLRLDPEITTNTRIKKIASSGDPDFIAVEPITVSADLIVELGVIIEFTRQASLTILEGGTIYAENASFVAEGSGWKGILIKSTGNTFTNCLIEGAGNASLTGNPEEMSAVILTGDASLAFSGNTLSGSQGYGILVKDQAGFFFDSENQVHAFRSNRYVDNALGPMHIPVSVLDEMSSQDFEEETQGSFIEIYGSTYPASATNNPWLRDEGIAYRIRGTVTFNRDLTINKGVEIYFDQGAGFQVNGKLNITGSADEPVILDGISSSPASWKGIYVHNGQADLNYLQLLNAGGEKFSALDEKVSLCVDQLLSMRNSVISGSGGIGLYLPGTAHIQYSDNFNGNTLESNAVSAIRIRMDDVSKVVEGNSISSPSGVPCVEIHQGVDDPPGTWKNLETDYDYRILESITIKATKELVLEAGTNIRMAEGTAIQVSGGLQAIGSAGSEISIGGSEAVKGHWNGILLDGTQEIRMEYLLIRDGGGGSPDMANLIVSPSATSVSITHSTINNSAGYGVLIKAGALDFNINEASSGNSLDGDLGGFFQETK